MKTFFTIHIYHKGVLVVPRDSPTNKYKQY